MKISKNTYLLISLLFFVTACQDEELLPANKPAAVGDEIIFGVRGGFENSDPKSRTVYTGEMYEYEGKTFERIDWVSGTDIIEVYSPDAKAPGTSDSNNSHFKIGTTDATTGLAALLRLEEAGSSLQWQGDGDHTFYALYPSTRMFDSEDSEGNLVTVDMGMNLTKTTLNGVVPNFQNPTEIVTTSTGYEAKPDMRYAYMAAKTTANRANGNEVKLTFVPFVTAVEIELLNPEDGEDLQIGEIQISTSDETAIAGAFQAQLSGWDGTGYPDCTKLDEPAPSTTIQISTRWYNPTSKLEEPIKLTTNQTLKFTVFLLPTQDLSNLVIKYSATGAEEYISKTLDFTTTEKKLLPAHLKTRIKELKLPNKEFEVDASNWMSQLPQATSMRKLSLPGTGGSFSYKYSGTDTDYYQQQTLNLEEQWKLGIRAFEVIVDRPSSASTTLGNEYVKCNKKSMEVTFNDVMKELTNWVSVTYPNECAVVILTYQPEGNDPSRNADSFAESLNTWYSSFANKNVLKKYTPDLTLGEAKGYVMVLVRLNQKDEKDGGTFAGASTALSGTPFVLIDGCGTAKDRWGARGYKVNDTNFPDISNSYSGNNIIETFMEDNYLFSTTDGNYTTSYTSGDYTITRAAADNPLALSFGFQTNDPNIICWYQEWARVVATPYMQPAVSGWHTSTPKCFWFESYFEKLNNATLTYDMAVSGGYSDHIFINSLCGYLTTEKYGDSTIPSMGYAYGGSGGDIKGLAEKITPAFYTHVLNRSKENTTGPTGIVMMDYLSKDPNEGGAYLLPGLIIANNFKHNK